MSLGLSPKRLERELKRLQFELKVAQRQTPYLRGMIEGTRDRLVLLNETGEILEYNSAFAEQFSEDEDAVIYGRHISTIYSRSPLSTESNSLSLITQTELNEGVLGRIYGFIGSEAIELELSTLRIHEKTLFVLSARPLNDRARHERELAQMRNELDELNERLSLEREQEKAQRVEALALLAGSLAHDLNNALAVVCGNLDLLEMTIEDSPSSNPETLEMIKDLRGGVNSASALSERLKTFTKGESAELKTLELGRWLEEISRVLSNAHQDRVRLSLPSREVWINADDSQLSQLVINLVTNAFQAMDTPIRDPQKSVHLVLTLGQNTEISSMMFSQQYPFKKGSVYAHLSVSDQGPGINEEHLQKIFDPFFSTKQGGSGIGLASAIKISFGHRGGISAENLPDGGARFNVAIPLLENPVRCEHQLTSLPTGRLTFPDLTVVLMDDEPHIRLTLKKILSLHGAQVYETSCCEEVLSIREQIFSNDLSCRARMLYLLDLNIEGGLSGIDTLHILKRLDPEIVAIACSGYFPLETGDNYHQLGFKAFVHKPFTSEELTKTIHRVINRNIQSPQEI